jgi:2-polyprenyl-3-methyl-5-hydroxy-6-metoxy-1,4-benzoquinol methylase
MSAIITRNECPCCKSTSIAKVLDVKDYTVSNDLFEVWHCNQCTSRFTQFVPDKNSIGPYYKAEAYVSHTDSKKGLINKLYHFVRNYTLGEKKKFIQAITSKKTGQLLDVGAGTGYFLQFMQQKGWSVTGLEPDKDARKVAAQQHGLALLPIETLFTLPAQQFDVITLWHVLEHVHDVDAYFEAFKNILKPGGHLLIGVPNYTSYDGKLYQEDWAAYDVPRHLYHFSPNSMEQLAKRLNCTVIYKEPMWFDSYYVSLLSEKNKHNGLNLWRMVKAAFIGFYSNLPCYWDKSKCSSVIYVIQPNN